MSILGRLGYVSQLLPSDIAATVTCVDDSRREPSGAPTMGIIAAMTDHVAGLAASPAAVPDIANTVHLSVHRTSAASATRPARGPLLLVGRSLRIGSRLITVCVDAYDGCGHSPDHLLDAVAATGVAPPRTADHALPLLARGIATYARITADHSAATIVASFCEEASRRIRVTDQSAEDRPITEQIGLRIVGEGTIDLDVSDGERNPRGVLSGLAYCLLFDESARSIDRGLSATDMELHFLAGVRSGTVRTTATPTRHDATHVSCMVSSVSTDRGDVTCTGSVTLGRAR